MIRSWRNAASRKVWEGGRPNGFRAGDAFDVEIVDYHRGLSANRLAIALGVPAGRITDILNGRRSITADTALRLARFFGNDARFWLDLQSQHDIAVIERERGREIVRRVTPVDAA